MKNKKLLSIIGALGLGVTAIPFHTGIANANSVIEEQESNYVNKLGQEVSLNPDYEYSKYIDKDTIMSFDTDINTVYFLDNTGRVLKSVKWNEYFSDISQVNFNKVADGLIVSITAFTSIMDVSPLIIKFDNNGDIVWEVNLCYGLDTMGYYTPGSIIELDDGSLLAPATKYLMPSNNRIVKISTDGTVTESNLPNPNIDIGSDVYLVKKDSNKMLLISNNGAWVEYDLQSNTILSEKNIGRSTYIVPLKDKIVVGNKLFNYDGSEIKTLNITGDEYLTSAVDPQGSFYILTYNRDHNDYNVIINKFTSDGVLIFSEQLASMPNPYGKVTLSVNNDGTINLILNNSGNTCSSEKPEPKYQGTSNLAVGVPVPNSLEMTMDTNTIDFTGYDGVSDTTNDTLSITVKSGLNYDLSATLTDEIRHSDGVTTMDKSHLRIKTSDDSDYKEFTDIGTPVTIVNNKQYGEHKHNINFKLIADSAVKAGDYEASVKFEVTQK